MNEEANNLKSVQKSLKKEDWFPKFFRRGATTSAFLLIIKPIKIPFLFFFIMISQNKKEKRKDRVLISRKPIYYR